MSGNNTLTGAILGALILKPDILENSDVNADDFPAGRLRDVFGLISEQWETTRPAEIDLVILAEKLTGDSPAAFVSSLIDGRTKTDSETFKRRVHELRRQRLQLRVIAATDKACRSMAKTGIVDPDEFATIRKGFEDLDGLDKVEPTAAELILGNLGDVKAEPVSWLWEPYFPIGKLVGIGGDPDAGKSWFALHLAACLSRGFYWPDGSKNNALGNTVYLSGEDDANDTLRPRIDSMGGDAAKLRYLVRDSLNLSDEKTINNLEDEIKKTGDVRLVVLDPAFDFSGTINPNAVEQARAFLGPLQAMTRRLSVCTLLIIHTKKGSVEKAIDWVGGSKSGWAGKLRALFGIERPADDPTRRIFFKIKANLAPVDPPQLAFRIVQGHLEFEMRPSEISLSDLLRPDLSGDGLQITEAVNFLRVALADGPLSAEDVKKQAKEAGYSERTIERAKPRAGVKSEKIGLHWRWTLGGLPNEKDKHTETR